MTLELFFTWTCQLALIAYIVYSFVLAFVYLILDIRHPFLGASSSYLVTYLMICAMPLIIMLSWTLYKTHFFGVAEILYLSMLIAAFENTIFLTKKFYWTNPKKEAMLNAVMHLFMGISIFFTVALFKKHESLLIYNFNSWQEFLWCGFSLNQLPSATREVLFILRIIPCVPLCYLWSFSISKKYDAIGKSFFEKAFNKPILLFLSYTILLAFALVLDLTPICQIVYAIVVLYLKLSFVKALFLLLETRTMEKIEVQYTMEIKKC